MIANFLGSASRLTTLSAAAALMTLSANPVVAAPQTLSFGIVPQQSASRLAKMWGPLLKHLSDTHQVKIEFRTTKDIPTFEACLAQGAFDFAYMNPMHYAIFSEVSGYQAIARQEKKKLKGVVIVRRDSEIGAVEDLAGERIAFPSPGAFGASILPRAEMRGREMDFEPVYVKSHDSVYRAVASGIVDAGGGVIRTFNAVDESVRSQLRILYETERYTPHAIAALSSVPDTLRTALQATLMEIGAAHPDLAKSVGMTGFEAAANADWDDVRTLEMSRDDMGISFGKEIACPSA